MKKLTSTFFEFHHFNIDEGTYVNKISHNFSDEDIENIINDLASFGIKYLVITPIGFIHEDGIVKTFYKSDIYPLTEYTRSKDPLESILLSCDRHNIKALLGTGYVTDRHKMLETFTDDNNFDKYKIVLKEIIQKYNHHKSLYGFYLPDEQGINDYFEEIYIGYVNKYSRYIKSFNNKYKIMISPYGTRHVKCDEKYINQLRNLECDIVAYQDEVGVNKSSPEDTAKYYKALSRCHKIAGKSKIWGNVETFTFEGNVYKSALIPASWERIKKQMEQISPFVSRLTFYTYQGIFNKEGTTPFIGIQETTKLYNDYMNYIKK